MVTFLLIYLQTYFLQMLSTSESSESQDEGSLARSPLRRFGFYPDLYFHFASIILFFDAADQWAVCTDRAVSKRE